MYLDVEEIPGIQRDGINLYSTVAISYLDAIMGSVVKVDFYLYLYSSLTNDVCILLNLLCYMV